MARKKKLGNSKFLEVAEKINSWKLVQRNGWAIKISMISEESILLVFASRYTGQAWVTYCYSERDAMQKIEMVTNRDAQEYLDNGISF